MRKVKAFHCTGSCAKEPVLATLSLRFAPILVREPCGRFAALLISTERHSIRQWKEALKAEGVTLLSHAVFGRGCAKQMVQAVQELVAQHERVHKTQAPRHFGHSLLYLDKSPKRLTIQSTLPNTSAMLTTSATPTTSAMPTMSAMHITSAITSAMPVTSAMPTRDFADF